ncbi:MAG: methionine--tRNA ligase [Deltaproteobacteria bacterium]
MSKKFYVTTPIYYVNALPHIGHAYTTICADALARYYRGKLGKEHVHFLTGTDEHGQKIQKAAQEQGKTPQQFVDEVSAKFRGLWDEFEISYDDYIRTTDPRHKKVVQQVLDILYKKGDIYESEYKGCYCQPCESFWVESQVTGEACPDCKRPIERIREKNFFFRISKYQDWLVKHIEANPDFVRPQIRRNEVLSFLKLNTLTDLCISRPVERLSWGIPLPFAPNHVTYVWFDALINYISAVGEFDDKGVYHSDWWPADLHLIGKDILRQHAIYWPIMLKALGIEPAKTVFAHGWWLMGDTKMSKSLGNVVNPIEMARKYGVDVFRYFLFRDVPFGLDGNFSEEAIVRRFNDDLANDLGNLVYRTLTMDEKYFGGKVPAVERSRLAADPLTKDIIAFADGLDRGLAEVFTPENNFDFSKALERIWALINMANKHVENIKPWNLAKENRTKELENFIRLLVEVIRDVHTTVGPFMPRTAALIGAQIGSDTINKGAPLFPRIETKPKEAKPKETKPKR